MKTFLPTIITLISLLSLVSCGQGGQSSASLQISRAFAMTNPNFGGGLIIAGKNITTGKTFSKGLTTALSLNIVLDKGTWLITATGWDGGSTSNVPFGGMPYCGKVTANLANENEVIDLNVTTAECASSFFAGSHPNMAGTSVKTLSLINTCNTFFGGPVGPADIISSSIVASGTATDNFCENIATDLQTKVESVKIYAFNKDLASTIPSLGFSSACIKAGTQRSKIDTGSTTPSNPYQSGSELRLPVAGIPFMIVTYDDNNCSKPRAQYPFKNGLGTGDPDKFDHLLYSRTSNEIKLILPGNDMRRGYSPFEAILPYFKRYNAGSPAKFLTAPASNSYQYHGILSQNNIAIIDNVSSCSTVTTDGTYVTSATCTDLGDNVQINWTGSTEGGGSFTMNSVVYTAYLDNGTFGRNRFETQKASMQLLGHDGDDNVRRFFEIKDHDDDSYGALSVARDILSAHAAGGALGISNPASSFASECGTRFADKEIKVFNWDDMQEETYRVVLHNTPTSAPTSFTCKNTNPDESNCASNGITFEKRMIIYDYKVSSLTPSMAVEFNCSNMMGRIETYSIEQKGVFKDESKEIVLWNTNEASSLQYQRFEKFSLSKRYLYNNGWNQIDENRQLARAIKSGTDDYEAWVFSFNTHKNLSNTFDQNLTYQQFKTNSTTNLNYIFQSAGTTNASSTYVFTDVANSTLVARSPVNSASGDNFFNPNDSFPQGSTGTSTSFYQIDTQFATAYNFNDTMTFNLATLNTNQFNVNTFGTSFLTTP